MHGLSWAGASRVLRAAASRAAGCSPVGSAGEVAAACQWAELVYTMLHSSASRDLVNMCPVCSERLSKSTVTACIIFIETRVFQIKVHLHRCEIWLSHKQVARPEGEFWPAIAGMGVLPLLLQSQWAYPCHPTFSTELQSPISSSVSPFVYEFISPLCL